MKKTQFAVRGKADDSTKQIRDALKQYAEQHPQAKIDIDRRLHAAIRIRIVDPDFAGIDRADRHDLIWDLFEGLSEDVVSEIYLLLLLTPKEAKTSIGNMEFDHPLQTEH
jgi:stress-induced morphogen